MSTKRKLEGNAEAKAAGAFVSAHQTMGKEEGFARVSKTWLDKTRDYDWGFKQLENEHMITNDARVPLKEVNPVIGSDGAFLFEYRDQQYRPTELALSQAMTKLNLPSHLAREILAGPHDVKGNPIRECSNVEIEGLMKIVNSRWNDLEPDKNYLFRFNQGRDNASPTLRCWLSEQYTIIDNRWVLEVFSKLIPDGRLSHWFGDEDSILTNILIPDQIRWEGDSDYRGMIHVGNGEIGNRRLEGTPSLFAGICRNGCIWGQIKGEGINLIHKRRGGEIDYEALRNEIANCVNEQIPLIPSIIDSFLATRDWKFEGATILPILAACIDTKSLGLQKAWAPKVVNAYNDQLSEENRHIKGTLFGLINAFTRAGRDSEGSTHKDLSEAGGRLAKLDKDDWSGLNRKAKNLTEDKIFKILPIGLKAVA